MDAPILLDVTAMLIADMLVKLTDKDLSNSDLDF